MYDAANFASLLREGSPWRVFTFDEVASTMDEARRLASEYPDQRHLVAVAQTQRAGLGRRGRQWASTADGLWMTALIRHDLPLHCAPWYTLAAAVCVAQALEDLGYDVGIKWPNDVLVADGPLVRRKLCGIRAELSAKGETLEWVSLGIGVNVNHERFEGELAPKAASLRQLGGRVESRTRVACAILDRLEQVSALLEERGFAPVRESWLSLALGLGEAATVNDEDGEVSGIVRGLDEEGHLLLEVEGEAELHTVYTGDLVC